MREQSAAHEVRVVAVTALDPTTLPGLAIHARHWLRPESDLHCWPIDDDAAQQAVDALSPRDVSYFSRYFGPLFPELLSRTWWLRGSPLLKFPFSWYPDFAGTIDEIDRIEQLVLSEPGGGWRLAPGDYLVRIANHLFEDELDLFGIPNSVCPLEQLLASVPRPWHDQPLPPSIWQHVDLRFVCRERIWGVFSAQQSLLERVRRHCEEIAHLYEVSAEIGADGDWQG